MVKEVYTQVDCEIVKVTHEEDGPNRAICILVDEEKYWIPASVCMNGHNTFDEGDEVILYVAEWFAKKKGLLED